MSRIEQAFRRAANLQAIDYDATLVNIDEYPNEPGAKESGTGFDRVAPSPEMSRQSSDTGRAVTLSVSPANDVPAPRLIAVPPPEGDASPLESSRRAFIVDDRSSLFQQRCRRVAAHLRDLQAQRELKTLMLTSVDETGGKTRAALSLAMALANASTRQVLLIDANLRRPLVHDLVGCGNDHGLADVLRGVTGVPLHRLTPLVHVLPAGSPVPYVPELASERMGTLLAQCAARYEWVLVDAPADSQLALGTFVHGAVFVIDSSTRFPVAGKAMSELGADRVVATILIGLEDAKP
jgi:Mrp family chromosome partitioning ATPase